MFYSWLTESRIIGLRKPTTILSAVAFFLWRYYVSTARKATDPLRRMKGRTKSLPDAEYRVCTELGYHIHTAMLRVRESASAGSNHMPHVAVWELTTLSS